MGRIAVTRQISAPVAQVFDVIAHVENFQKAVTDIVGIEFTTTSRKGVGTRFKETRRMGKREATVELEVTEYEVDRHVRIVSDAGGTVWDTVFRVAPAAGGTELTMVMDDRPYKLLARCLTPLIRGMVRKAVQRDMDAVKAYCEGASTSA